MNLDPSDILICVGDGDQEQGFFGAAAPPIAQTSLFTRSTFEELIEALDREHEQFVYTRGQNPTVQLLEEKIARLERGEMCKCFSSGMAAVSAVFLGLLEAGDHILFVNQIYGPTLELAAALRHFGVRHDVVLDLSVDAVAESLRPETRLIWFESPGTMLLRTLDITELVELARSRGILTAMDNSWATPLLQKPLENGVDLVMHTCSKYIGGHSDVIAGAVIGSRELMERIFYRAYMLHGGVLGPFDAWLLIRGLRTLPARLAQHERDSLEVARFLEGHEAVRRIFHPALDRREPPGLRGYSGLLSFEIEGDGFEDVCAVLNRLEVFRIGVSWGGVESLAISPNRGNNREALASRGIPEGLIRLSIGLEGSPVLTRDLAQALSGLKR